MKHSLQDGTVPNVDIGENVNMQWQTAEGKVIAICEMSDAHLTNSIAMCLRENRLRSYDILREEQWRRKNVKFMAQTRVCPFCPKRVGRMVMQYFEPEREIGSDWFGEYRFQCERCGATSNPITRKMNRLLTGYVITDGVEYVDGMLGYHAGKYGDGLNWISAAQQRYGDAFISEYAAKRAGDLWGVNWNECSILTIYADDDGVWQI